MAWLEAERRNLLAAVDHAAACGLHAHAWQLPHAMTRLFVLRCDHDDWIATHERALASARHLDDHRGQADTLTSLGVAHLRAGHYDEALDHLQQALPLFRGRALSGSPMSLPSRRGSPRAAASSTVGSEVAATTTGGRGRVNGPGTRVTSRNRKCSPSAETAGNRRVAGARQHVPLAPSRELRCQHEHVQPHTHPRRRPTVPRSAPSCPATSHARAGGCPRAG